ncbi:MAG: DNA-binding NtrC family response regulator [Pseudohongiellaceae bacterium]|jgi:DNA-binding NtrC family response regulator
MRSILIVDDDELILKLLARTIRNERHSVSVFLDPENAISACRRQNFDVVISDLKMPHMSGVEFLELVLEISPETRRILISGYKDSNGVIDAFNENIIHKFVNKPWGNDEIRNLVEEQISIVENLEEGIWVKNIDEFLSLGAIDSEQPIPKE